MLVFDPFMPVYLVGLYIIITFATLLLCWLCLLAIYRTKKTPYSTKILSIGLLTFNILFLIFSSISKLFNYDDSYYLWHISRGFQISAQFVVSTLALERLFVLNWPYLYLRIATDYRIKRVCVVIFVVSFVQYVTLRGLMCYANNKARNCGRAYSIYFVIVSLLMPAVSFISFAKIYSIIRQKGDKNLSRHYIRQYKGTIAAFSVLINATITQVTFLGLSLFYVIRTAKGMKETGLVSTLADWGNVINCIVDPLIYVVWFTETRLELLKMLRWICPCVTPKIQKLRVQIFYIQGSSIDGVWEDGKKN